MTHAKRLFKFEIYILRFKMMHDVNELLEDRKFNRNKTKNKKQKLKKK